MYDRNVPIINIKIPSKGWNQISSFKKRQPLCSLSEVILGITGNRIPITNLV
jgi:hypothetical protein